GGAGGLHAVSLARSLRIPKVLVPRHPGILSALGMMVADVVRDYSKTVMLRGSEASFQLLKDMFREMERKALEDMSGEGLDSEDVFLEPLLDMRYKGQSYELLVPFSEDYEETFHREHERVYGYRHSTEVEIVNLRLRAVGRTRKPELPSFEERSREDPSDALTGYREVLFRGEFLRAGVYNRERLRWGNIVEGPAVVVEYSSTTFIPPGSRAQVDRFGNLVVDVN
ncbi:MAG: hydantoinase/oxoprolinase family protein, partial [Aquificota bacterium]|nr:hydantoinase/oxoprolinase family protein [Aquificota bacterium]